MHCELQVEDNTAVETAETNKLQANGRMVRRSRTVNQLLTSLLLKSGGVGVESAGRTIVGPVGPVLARLTFDVRISRSHPAPAGGNQPDIYHELGSAVRLSIRIRCLDGKLRPTREYQINLSEDTPTLVRPVGFAGHRSSDPGSLSGWIGLQQLMIVDAQRENLLEIQCVSEVTNSPTSAGRSEPIDGTIAVEIRYLSLNSLDFIPICTSTSSSSIGYYHYLGGDYHQCYFHPELKYPRTRYDQILSEQDRSNRTRSADYSIQQELLTYQTIQRISNGLFLQSQLTNPNCGLNVKLIDAMRGRPATVLREVDRQISNENQIILRCFTCNWKNRTTLLRCQLKIGLKREVEVEDHFDDDDLEVLHDETLFVEENIPVKYLQKLKFQVFATVYSADYTVHTVEILMDLDNIQSHPTESPSWRWKNYQLELSEEVLQSGDKVVIFAAFNYDDPNAGHEMSDILKKYHIFLRDCQIFNQILRQTRADQPVETVRLTPPRLLRAGEKIPAGDNEEEEVDMDLDVMDLNIQEQDLLEMMPVFSDPLQIFNF